MENKLRASVLRPHDTYFEQVFKVLPVALQLIRQQLSQDQLAALNLDTLHLSAESFLDEEMQESFSDLVYTCETADSLPTRVALIFEHKSSTTGRRLYIQLWRYLQGMMEEDIKQKRSKFTVPITIVFYHGEQRWRPGLFREQFGVVLPALQDFIPHLGFHFISLQAIPDEEIYAMEQAMLLKNIFLTFKHAWDDNFFRAYYKEVFIFADESVSEENLLDLFQSTFLYVQIVSSISKLEIMEMVQTLPPQYERRAKSTYQQFLEQGIEQGIEQGKEQGKEELVRVLMLKRPEWSDLEIAEILDLELEFVTNVRKQLEAKL